MDVLWPWSNTAGSPAIKLLRHWPLNNQSVNETVSTHNRKDIVDCLHALCCAPVFCVAFIWKPASIIILHLIYRAIRSLIANILGFGFHRKKNPSSLISSDSRSSMQHVSLVLIVQLHRADNTVQGSELMEVLRGNLLVLSAIRDQYAELKVWSRNQHILHST